MAARPTWKGYLKISLVNIPIKVFPATDAGATLSFNQLHGECQTRIQQKRWCPKCEREVPNTDIVKGFEFEKGRYVIVDEEDIEKVRVDSTRVINLDMPGTVKPAEVKLAKQVIGTFEGDVDLQEYRDDYQVGLREIIDAKIEGREIVAPEVEAPPKVVNLMEALRKSLDTIGARKKPATVSQMAAGKKQKRA